jgi:hypothetical protein
MTISSIRERDFHRDDFTDAETAAMQKDGDTSKVMNDVRRQAGAKTSGVDLRGDDKTAGELKKEWSDHDLGHATLGLVEHNVCEFAEGTLLEMAGPIAFGVHASIQLIEANHRAKELEETGEKGAMHLAMVSALHLPESFKNVEVSKWKDSGTAFQSGAVKMGTQLEAVDRDKAAVLQLHADRGMNAANDLIARGVITRDGSDDETKAALAKDPALKKKYDDDPAFRAGFDALVWCKRHDSPEELEKQTKELGDRDLRYVQHHIPCRG